MEAKLCVMNDAVYFDNCGDTETPLFSSTIGKILVTQSPLHAHAAHPLLGGRARKPTAAMDEGKILDALITGNGDSIAVTDDFDDFKKHAAQEWRDAQIAAGRLPMVRRKFDHFDRAAKMIRKRLDDAGCKLDGVWQAVILCELHASNGSPVKCKAKLDHLDPMTGLVTDLKKVGGSAKPDKKLGNYIVGLGYEIQAAMYPLVVEQWNPAFVGRSAFEWAFAESEFPHAVSRVAPSGSMRALGNARLQQAIDTWEECLRTDRWPGYEGVTRIEATPWMLEDARIDEVTE